MHICKHTKAILYLALRNQGLLFLSYGDRRSSQEERCEFESGAGEAEQGRDCWGGCMGSASLGGNLAVLWQRLGEKLCWPAINTIVISVIAKIDPCTYTIFSIMLFSGGFSVRY